MKKGVQIHVHFTDGEVLSGDRNTWEELVAAARSENGRRVTEAEVEEATNQIVAMFEKLGKLETMSIKSGGADYGINPKYVKYVKIERI